MDTHTCMVWHTNTVYIHANWVLLCACPHPRSSTMPTAISTTSLNLQPVQLPTTDVTLLCNMSIDIPHPYVPSSLRRSIFDHFFSLSHPGVRATQRLLTSWPQINTDVRQWTHACLNCQQSKVHSHTVYPKGTFLPPDARFERVHVDLVGPLPPSQGFTYLLTSIHLLAWGHSLTNFTMEVVANAFLSGG